MQDLDIKIIQFINKNSIDLSKIHNMLDYTINQIPGVEFTFDITTYGEFGILRVLIDYDNKNIQPLLFGTPDNLSNLSKYLWKQQTTIWSDTLQGISSRAAFLRKEVLIPQIIKVFCKYNAKDFVAAEIGCGNGIIVKELMKYSQTVYGIDISEEFIDKLKEENPENKDKFLVYDIANSNLKEQYDIIICSMLLLDIPQIDKALDNIYNLIKTNGILIIADINPDTYKALGYLDGTELIAIHDKDTIFSTEKWISGETKAVHNYHPYNLYRNCLESKDMECLEDFTFGPTYDLIMNNSKLNNHEKERLLSELKIDFSNPLYRCLVMKK
ncbi:MAG: class I SAM-dependent methyltransferase [Ignavibacteriales bacterium]